MKNSFAVRIRKNRVIRVSFQTIRDIYKKFFFKLIKLLSKVLRPKLFLSYENEGKPDGIGAQVQRILAIKSLSINLGFKYIHTGIKSVAVHPLDPYQSPEELQAFLVRLNLLFHIEDSTPNQIPEMRTHIVKNLSFMVLFRKILESAITRKPIQLFCVEPYPVSEFDSDKFQNTLDFLPNYPARPRSRTNIAVHYRRGVGGFAVQKGEKVSREIEENYFRGLINAVIESFHPGTDFELTIFTDSPAQDLSYIPPEGQHDLWENSPKFHSGIMEVKGLNLEEVFSDMSPKVSIIYGGDPLDSIIQMSFSDYLIMSRSSFSYVAAILNDSGKIYFPRSFWHRPMPEWIVIDEKKYV